MTVPSGSKGNAVRTNSNVRFRGCPRNCKRRAFAECHWVTPYLVIPGKAAQAVTREPGDLPLVVVTREHIGRGVLVVAESCSLRAWSDFVRGDVPR